MEHGRETPARGLGPGTANCAIPAGISCFQRNRRLQQTIVNPTLKRLESIGEQLRQGTFEGLDLKELLEGCRSQVKQSLKGARTLSRLIRSQVGRTNFEDVSLSDVGQPYDIEIQDVFELEGRKIFLHFTVIFDVTLEGVIPGDDMWAWRSVSPPWVTMIRKALPFKLKPAYLRTFLRPPYTT